MGPRDLTDRLLDAFRKNSDDASEVDVAEVDRRYSELISSGRLSEAKLREAFDRRFPPAPAGGETALTVGRCVGALQARWASAAKLADEFGLPADLVERMCASAEVLSTEAVPAIARSFGGTDDSTARVRKLLSKALVTMSAASAEGQALQAARSPPKK